MKIAILGYGVVGSGVAEVLRLNAAQISQRAKQAIEVKYILDLRDFPDDPLEKCFVKDFTIIEKDPEVAVVVESIGGETVAYDFAKRALLAGKTVCTPNKALIAAHGAELLAIAREKSVGLLFEASVGGGIPLIRPFCDALLIDEVQAVSGILNGTSNYILTQMNVHGAEYADALKEAQKLGYAEQDPTADVGGFDACRKLSIMLSMATGKTVDYTEVTTEGIDNIGAADFAFAKASGFTLKQIVDARCCENGVEAITAPFLVSLDHPMAVVSDVYNGCFVRGLATGSTMFYGSGAGKLPTAAAVISNIVDAATGAYNPAEWIQEKAKILPVSKYVYRRAVRVTCENPLGFAAAVCANASPVILPEYPGQVMLLSDEKTEAEAATDLEKLKNIPGYKAVERVLRVYK